MCSPYTDALIAGGGTLKTVTLDLGTDAPCGFLPGDLTGIQSAVRAWLLARHPSLLHDPLHSVVVRPSGSYTSCGSGCGGSHKSSSGSDGEAKASSSDSGCDGGSDEHSKRRRLAGTLVVSTSASSDATFDGLASTESSSSSGKDGSYGSDSQEGGDKDQHPGVQGQGTTGAKL